MKKIHAWKRQLEAEENPLPVYPAPRTAEERFAIKKVKTKFTRHKGRESFMNNDKKTSSFLPLNCIGSGAYQ
jgi:hypothetical protein